MLFRSFDPHFICQLFYILFARPPYGNEKYNVPEGHQGAGLGVTALGAYNYYTPEALKAFLEGFDLPVPEIQILTSSMFEGMNATYCRDNADSPLGCSESELDTQMITSYGTGAEFGFIAGKGYGVPDVGWEGTEYDWFVQFREAFIESNVKPDILSLSFGVSTSNSTEIQETDDILMEFVASGITVLVASGKK